ncbi:MAG: hypothetical protein QOI15_2031 [Pseudonocardiales bacterium]|jgi:uncharacterized protein (TIGR03085 family)|nr:hypothetical protein [Pseudonocardiales bacterium]
MVHFAVSERRALAETLRQAGPDAPTLSGKWTAAQLAAHLVLRERAATELLGRLPNERLQRIAERAIDRLVAREPYEQIVQAVEDGPSWRDARLPVPTALVWAVPAVRERANLLEYLVHHEDVRRAAPEWAPRELPADFRAAVYERLPMSIRLTMRRVPVGVALVSPGHREVLTPRAKRHGAQVTVTGEPVELVLFAFGRRTVADVELAGDPADIATVRKAPVGL